MADFPEGIGGVLHPLGVGVDGEVALGHAVEFLPKNDSARLFVRLEQGLDGDEQIRFHGEVENLIIDGAIHPATDAGIRLRPRGVSRARVLRAIDVTEQPVLGAESGEESLPLGEVGALEAEGDRDVLLHVDGVGDVEGRSDSVPQRASCLGTNDARDGGRSRQRSQHDDRGLGTTALVRHAA